MKRKLKKTLAERITVCKKCGHLFYSFPWLKNGGCSCERKLFQTGGDIK